MEESTLQATIPMEHSVQEETQKLFLILTLQDLQRLLTKIWEDKKLLNSKFQIIALFS